MRCRSRGPCLRLARSALSMSPRDGDRYQLAIGSIVDGIDVERAAKTRDRIHREAFESPSAKQFPLVSYCPVAIYQKYRDFTREWSREYCEMIEVKAKLVAKHYLELMPLIDGPSRASVECTEAVAGTPVAR